MDFKGGTLLIFFSLVLRFSDGLSASLDSQKLQPRIFNQDLDVEDAGSKGGREGRRMNVPPMLKLPSPPLWSLPVSTAVSSRIYTLQTSGPTPPGVSYVYTLDPVDPSTDYFSLDNHTGIVTLKKPLDMQKHRSFTVIPGVTDGELTARSEIRVVVSKDGEIGVAEQPGNWPGNLPGGGFFPPNFSPPTARPRPPKVRTTAFTFGTSQEPVSSIATASDEPSSTIFTTEHPGRSEPVPPPSDSKNYLAFLAIPAAIVLLVPLAICYCRRRNYQRALGQEKIRIEKSPSADTTKSICKGSVTDFSAEYPGPPLKKFLQAAPSNNRYLGRRKSASASFASNLLTSSDGYLQPDMTDEMWEVPRDSIVPETLRLIGEGCSGQVFRAEALEPSGAMSVVAIKTLKANADERAKQDLLNELQVMKSLAKDAHPNVVSLLGCCTLEDPIYVIMEFLEHGKLQSYLRNSRDSHYYGNIAADNKEAVTSKQLTQFGYQIASGMDYLSKRGILHRDLAARNILLDENKVCKVSDFGLARDVIDSHIYTRVSACRLPVRWMAPESLHDSTFTSKSDVWSFGILLWEICTLGSTPYAGIGAHEVAKRVLNAEFRLAKPPHCERELYNIMYYCWAARDVDRPTFSELKKMLEQLLTVDVDYLHMDNFPDNYYYNTLPVNSEEADKVGEKL